MLLAERHFSLDFPSVIMQSHTAERLAYALCCFLTPKTVALAYLIRLFDSVFTPRESRFRVQMPNLLRSTALP